MGNCNGNEKLIAKLSENIGELYNNMTIIAHATNELVDVINTHLHGNLPHVTVTEREMIQINAERLVELNNTINDFVEKNMKDVKVRLEPEIFRNLLDITISSEEATWPTTADELKEDIEKSNTCVTDLEKNTGRYIEDVESIKVQTESMA